MKLWKTWKRCTQTYFNRFLSFFSYYNQEFRKIFKFLSTFPVNSVGFNSYLSQICIKLKLLKILSAPKPYSKINPI